LIRLQRAVGRIATPEGETGREDNGTVQIDDQEKVRFSYAVTEQ